MYLRESLWVPLYFSPQSEWCLLIDWCAIQGVSLPFIQCSQDSLKIHYNLDPDKPLIEDEGTE